LLDFSVLKQQGDLEVLYPGSPIRKGRAVHSIIVTNET